MLEFLLGIYALFVGFTSRLEVTSPVPLTEIRSNKKKALYAFWHNRIFYFLYLFRKSGIAIPISTHRDGAAIARIARRFGFNVIPGSSTRGSIGVLNGILDYLARDRAVAVTPDGPRGPKYSIQDGILFASYKSKTPIRASAWYAKHVILFRSWDNFILPLPFNTFCLAISEEIRVDSKEDMLAKKVLLKKYLDKVTYETENRFKK
jgi:lysophospholipid acyltransferase (LPLAT)-like uncharacterized protein